MVDFLTANGWASSTWAGWFPSGGETPLKPADSFGFADVAAFEPVLRADSGLAGWDDLYLMGLAQV